MARSSTRARGAPALTPSIRRLRTAYAREPSTSTAGPQTSISVPGGGAAGSDHAAGLLRRDVPSNRAFVPSMLYAPSPGSREREASVMWTTQVIVPSGPAAAGPAAPKPRASATKTMTPRDVNGLMGFSQCRRGIDRVRKRSIEVVGEAYSAPRGSSAWAPHPITAAARGISAVTTRSSGWICCMRPGSLSPASPQRGVMQGTTWRPCRR
jgi:hypothetical protein